MSKSRRGAASQVLAILPVIAHIVLCEDIRAELVEKAVELLGWTEQQVLARYGPVLDAAVWITPAPEQSWHSAIVSGDPDDTMLPRVAEAVFTECAHLTETDQHRYIVSENTRDLRPGSSAASFLFVTAHDLLRRLE